MGLRRKQRQLDMDFGDGGRWKELPEGVRRRCIELLSLLLTDVVWKGCAGVEEVHDERR